MLFQMHGSCNDKVNLHYTDHHFEQNSEFNFWLRVFLVLDVRILGLSLMIQEAKGNHHVLTQPNQWEVPIPWWAPPQPVTSHVLSQPNQWDVPPQTVGDRTGQPLVSDPAGRDHTSTYTSSIITCALCEIYTFRQFLYSQLSPVFSSTLASLKQNGIFKHTHISV